MKKEKIIVENLSKRFSVELSRSRSVLESLIDFLSGNRQREIWALKNVSFKVQSGEIVGLIGKNGSGKTTLLRTIAGIYKSGGARIAVEGKIMYLSNLSSGLKLKLSVKDNIFLLGSILGLEQKDVKRNLNEIVEFAGLEDFFHLKIYQLSSGMKQRLTFSVMINCVECLRPDIILLDEVFSGGKDEEFKRKAFQRMRNLAGEEKVIVLASHKIDLIRRFCQRTLWIDKGELIEDGETEEVIKKYLDSITKDLEQ